MGVLGVAAVFAVAPQAHADAAAQKQADSSSAPQRTGVSTSGVAKKAAPRVDPAYGIQKYRVGVQLKDGSYAPAPAAPDTLTGDTTLTITETGPNAPAAPHNTTTCTTTDASQDPGTTTTYCDHGQLQQALMSARFPRLAPRLTVRPTPTDAPPNEFYIAAPGDTITIVQTTVRPNLVKDTSTAVLEPCVADMTLGLPCTGSGGVQFVKTTDLIFDDTGVPPTASDDSAQVPFDGRAMIDVLANDDTNSAPVTGLTVSSAPGHGSATVVSTSSGKQIRYVPRKGFYGSDTFDYTLTTANGTASATVTVDVPAPRPVAKDDSSETTRDQGVTVDVLANDDTKGVDLVGIHVAGAPKHGMAHVVHTASGPQIRYTPATDFVGTDTFDYTLRTDGGTSTATVTVTVAAPPPDAVDDSSATKSGKPVTVAVTSNDASNGGGAITVTSVSDPHHGTATIDGDNVVYTSDDAFVGTDTFTYTISTSGGTDTATVTVTVNDAGVLANTGVDSAGLLGLGGGLLITGGAVTLAGRRRRAGRHGSPA